MTFLVEFIVFCLWLPNGTAVTGRNLAFAGTRAGIYISTSGMGYMLVSTIQNSDDPDSATWVTSTVKEILGVKEPHCESGRKKRSSDGLFDFLFEPEVKNKTNSTNFTDHMPTSESGESAETTTVPPKSSTTNTTDLNYEVSSPPTTTREPDPHFPFADENNTTKDDSQHEQGKGTKAEKGTYSSFNDYINHDMVCFRLSINTILVALTICIPVMVLGCLFCLCLIKGKNGTKRKTSKVRFQANPENFQYEMRDFEKEPDTGFNGDRDPEKAGSMNNLYVPEEEETVAAIHIQPADPAIM